MSSMDFGLCIPCFANPGAAFFRTPRWSALDPQAAVEAGVQAERLGYDSLWMADHFIHGVDGGILEGWTTLCVLAGRTNRIQLGTIHMSDAFRQPSLTAKMTSTLDALSDGRFIFFFDAGWGLDEQRAYGYPDRPASERLERLGESLDLITQLWSGATVNYAGKHFHTQDAVCLPKPVRVPPIWLGEVRDDAYLDIIGRYADGWNSVPVSPQQFGERWAKVASACTRAGRDPDTLTRSLEIQILIAPTRSAVRQILEECAALPISPRIPANATIVNYLKSAPADAPPLPEDIASHWLIGTPDEVHAQLGAYAREGVSHLMLWFADFPSHDGTRLFADEVMPRWRA